MSHWLLKKQKRLKIEWLLLPTFLVFLSNCASRDPVKGPVCIINKSDSSMSCGQSDPMKMWKAQFKDADGWVCYPPKLSEELWEWAAKGKYGK